MTRDLDIKQYFKPIQAFLRKLSPPLKNPPEQVFNRKLLIKLTVTWEEPRVPEAQEGLDEPSNQPPEVIGVTC